SLGGEHPFDASPDGVALSLPGGDLGHDTVALANAPVEALPAQHADLDLDHIEPAGVLRGRSGIRNGAAPAVPRRPGMFRTAPPRNGLTGCPARPGSARLADNGCRRVRACTRRSRRPHDAR